MNFMREFTWLISSTSLVCITIWLSASTWRLNLFSVKLRLILRVLLNLQRREIYRVARSRRSLKRCKKVWSRTFSTWFANAKLRFFYKSMKTIKRSKMKWPASVWTVEVPALLSKWSLTTCSMWSSVTLRAWRKTIWQRESWLQVTELTS